MGDRAFMHAFFWFWIMVTASIAVTCYYHSLTPGNGEGIQGTIVMGAGSFFMLCVYIASLFEKRPL